jgi:hypothetical protein
MTMARIRGSGAKPRRADPGVVALTVDAFSEQSVRWPEMVIDIPRSFGSEFASRRIQKTRRVHRNTPPMAQQ